jgi:uncharacterized protein (TIGR00251 family)
MGGHGRIIKGMASKQRSKASAKTPAQAAAPAKAARNTTGDTFFGWDGEVLVLNVLGKPSASKDAIGKPKGTQLKISVTAAPKDGKATDYMVRFLAPLFGVAVADIEVVFGQENVNKQLRIRAPKKLPAVFTDAAAPAD